MQRQIEKKMIAKPLMIASPGPFARYWMTIWGNYMKHASHVGTQRKMNGGGTFAYTQLTRELVEMAKPKDGKLTSKPYRMRNFGRLITKKG